MNMAPNQQDKEWDFNPHNPTTQIAMLGLRVENLGREKEKLEREIEEEKAARLKVEDDLRLRLEKIESSLGKGAGILIGLGSLGTISGFLIAYGKTIFAPWTK